MCAVRTAGDSREQGTADLLDEVRMVDEVANVSGQLGQSESLRS